MSPVMALDNLADRGNRGASGFALLAWLAPTQNASAPLRNELPGFRGNGLLDRAKPRCASRYWGDSYVHCARRRGQGRKGGQFLTTLCGTGPNDQAPGRIRQRKSVEVQHPAGRLEPPVQADEAVPSFIHTAVNAGLL